MVSPIDHNHFNSQKREYHCLSFVSILTYSIISIVGLNNTLSAQEHIQPPLIHSCIGDTQKSSDGRLSMTNIGKKQQYATSQTATFDNAIYSPKSAAFHPDGTRFYVNSLEGCCTSVYDALSLDRLKVIHHRFPSGNGSRWAVPSGYYPWSHYPDGQKRPFNGKPVEMTFSHGGRYLWIPYYRRTFDINAQDPSAIAVIDTRRDTIVRMFETGPLPKMVTVSNSGKLLAVTHWGDNTVGFIDISSPRPKDWQHLRPITIGKKLQLDYPLDTPVNRDADSGYLLRGTVFLPGDRYLLVGCMAGGIAVIDMLRGRHIGFINAISNVRHLASDRKHVYASSNISGTIHKIPIDSINSAIHRAGQSGSRTIKPEGWSSCRVGKGARTLEISPDGNHIFVACNSVSELHVVDARTMKSIASIRCDSYPVGLCISPDGEKVIVTSQGRNRLGGNAVNIFRLTSN